MMEYDPDFEALKSLTRLSWLLDFGPTATTANSDDAAPAPSPA